MICTTYTQVVGAILAIAREDARLSQGDVAVQTGVTPSGWSRVERGHTAATVAQLSAVAPVLKAWPGEMLQRADIATAALVERDIRVWHGRQFAPPNVINLGGVELRKFVREAIVRGMSGSAPRRRTPQRDDWPGMKVGVPCPKKGCHGRSKMSHPLADEQKEAVWQAVKANVWGDEPTTPIVPECGCDCEQCCNVKAGFCHCCDRDLDAD